MCWRSFSYLQSQYCLSKKACVGTAVLSRRHDLNSLPKCSQCVESTCSTALATVSRPGGFGLSLAQGFNINIAIEQAGSDTLNVLHPFLCIQIILRLHSSMSVDAVTFQARVWCPLVYAARTYVVVTQAAKLWSSCRSCLHLACRGNALNLVNPPS